MTAIITASNNARIYVKYPAGFSDEFLKKFLELILKESLLDFKKVIFKEEISGESIENFLKEVINQPPAESLDNKDKINSQGNPWVTFW